MYLDSPFELQGNWWLPSNPDKKISGILKCSKSGRVELEVMGTFFDLPTGINDLPTLPIILGTSDNGKSITLVHCMHLTWSINFSGSGNSKLLIKFLLVGEHFPNESELTFSQITFKTFALDEWLGISGFTTNHDFEKEVLDIHFIPPATIQKKINDEITLSVKFTWSGFPLRPLNSIELTRIKWTQLMS